jgi:hypothetical protein
VDGSFRRPVKFINGRDGKDPSRHAIPNNELWPKWTWSSKGYDQNGLGQQQDLHEPNLRFILIVK